MSTQKPELGAEEKIRTLIDDITNNISKPSSHFGDALDAASKYSEEDQKQYAYFREVFRQLREKLKTIPDIKLIDEQIREALEKGLNPDLIVKETLVHKNFIIFLERLILIINTAQKMEKNELNFGHIGPEFDKYLVSNFYRTMCEVTIKLFINLLTSILNYWLKDLSQKITQTEEELDKIDYWKKLLKKIEKNSLGLHDFKTILTTLDKRENFNLNLNRLVETVFCYESGEGFKFRNIVAHEKLLLSEIDIELLINEIYKISRFNHAFMQEFLFNSLGGYIKSDDVEPVRGLFLPDS